VTKFRGGLKKPWKKKRKVSKGLYRRKKKGAVRNKWTDSSASLGAAKKKVKERQKTTTQYSNEESKKLKRNGGRNRHGGEPETFGREVRETIRGTIRGGQIGSLAEKPQGGGK